MQHAVMTVMTLHMGEPAVCMHVSITRAFYAKCAQSKPHPRSKVSGIDAGFMESTSSVR